MVAVILDKQLAMDYGVEEALILQHFYDCIGQYKIWLVNEYDNKTWSFECPNSLVGAYPFWTANQIKRILDSLVSQGALVRGNYYEKDHDPRPTECYAFKDESWLKRVS